MSKEIAKMTKPQLTEDDKTVIDDVLDYLCDGLVEEPDAEFECLVDRLIRLNRKLAKLG